MWLGQTDERRFFGDNFRPGDPVANTPSVIGVASTLHSSGAITVTVNSVSKRERERA